MDPTNEPCCQVTIASLTSVNYDNPGNKRGTELQRIQFKAEESLISEERPGGLLVSMGRLDILTTSKQ